MDEAVQGLRSDSRPAASPQQVFQESVHDNIQLVGDLVSPLGKLPFHIEDFLDPDILLLDVGPSLPAVAGP
jgi:hypothetical protein